MSSTQKDEGHTLKILGVFAHPDDEVFCLGGTLAKYVAEGAETMVVSFTRGEAGQIRDAAVATRRTLGEKREQELFASCKQLGVQHVRCFDYGDGKLKDIAQEVLVGRIVQIIREFQPDVVITFDDTGAYGHPDHIAISRATTVACRNSGNAEAYHAQIEAGLMPHQPARLYHSYFPRNDRLLLQLIVQWLKTLDTRFRGSTEFIQALLLFADESSMLGYAADHLEVEWYPKSFYIIEQGEPAITLYLILSGVVDIFVEDSTGDMRYLESHGPGTFIGETGLIYGRPRNAHVVAAENTTCLVFSPGEPTNFAGRGEGGEFATGESLRATTEHPEVTVVMDVRDWVPVKVAAMSQHRTQYPVTQDMFPLAMMREMLGLEYFIQVLPPVMPQTELFPPEQRR